mgnify:CR=1 FL=1
MANKVLLKKSSVGAKVPLTTDLDYGELALNYADGKLYYKTSGVTIDSFPSATATSTLTNKTLTSPTINGGALSGTFSGTPTFSGAITLSDTTASTSTTTGALKVAGGLGVAGAIYADTIRALNNGNGTNVYVGDDIVLGDINQANTLGLRGQQDSTQAYIVFGSSNNTAYIGRSGTNPIQVTGQFKVDSGTVTGGSAIALQITGYANKGGTGYHDFLSVTNGYSLATNPNKYFRISSDGQFQIINSAYTTNIFNITDDGKLTVPAISIGGSTGTAGQVLQSTGTGLQWASVGGTGTVTSITAGTGLTGGTITTSGTIAIDTTVVTTLTGSQTLTNKTLTSPTINSATANNLTLTGTVTAGASTGTNGQVLQSTGTGVQWATVSTLGTTYTQQAEFGVTGISTSTTVYSFATATYRSAKYFITITNGTNYGTYEFMVSHDGTIVYLSGNNNDYVISGTSVNYFSGDYVEEVLDLNTRIEIGTMGHSLNWAISAGSLVFSAASTTGTISVKGFVTLIKV